MSERITKGGRSEAVEYFWLWLSQFSTKEGPRTPFVADPGLVAAVAKTEKDDQPLKDISSEFRRQSRFLP
ncbi:hypothetical protein [Bradyrhizobium erythrophlei]|uniref:hypothetical protein n=1 Tax=Bradyrhizobium erythrophlei TaxID=1437360 RepID=UPI0012EBDED7|nr:hypothetical protein [Bradyrhizobium erythrophlei]